MERALREELSEEELSELRSRIRDYRGKRAKRPVSLKGLEREKWMVFEL